MTTKRPPPLATSSPPSGASSSGPAPTSTSPTPSVSPSAPLAPPLESAPPRFRDLPPDPPATPPPPLQEDAPDVDPTDGFDAPQPPRSSAASTSSLAGALIGIIATGVTLVSYALHAWRTPGNENDVWLMAEDELTGIAEPLSRIAARRLPAGLGSPDVGDGVTAATAGAAYAVRSIGEEVVYRRTQHGDIPAPPVAGDVAEPEGPPAPFGTIPADRLEQMGRS